MIARRFTSKDMHSICKWHELHRGQKLKTELLPRLGFIVPGVAAGFLRACEGGYGIFDSLITNPYASGAVRHAGLEAIFNSILRTPDVHHIFGFTRDTGALSRARAAGFVEVTQTVLSYTKE